MEKKKNTKKIVIIIVAAIIVVALAVTGIVCLNTGKKSGGKSGDAQATTVSSDKKKGKDKDKDPWSEVEVVEETTKSKKDKEVLYKRNKKGEIVTNKKGEKVTRKADYPGEDDGWSPIVSPDDLKKDK